MQKALKEREKRDGDVGGLEGWMEKAGVAVAEDKMKLGAGCGGRMRQVA